MKNIIYNLYNILINEINKEKYNYYFYYKNELYYLNLVENDIETINYCYSHFKKNNLECYEIISNNKNELISKVDDKKYCLLKIKGLLKYELKFEDFKYYLVNKEPLDWNKLWSNRLDYYSSQIRELGYHYQTLLNTYGFFEGLAENAILYYNLTLKKFNENISVGIVHNRMNYPCYSLDYYNPINFVVDYNIRDISEYIKSYMLNENYDIYNVITLLKKMNINKLMFNILYSRLLYPSNYFDLFDKIILENEEDKKVITIINKAENYIKTLKYIYYEFKDKYEMFNIEWINKNAEN